MTKEQAIAFIDKAYLQGPKPGLERVRKLLERMGSPHKELKFVHVAGTNGKGSTCAMLSGILSAAGYRTGTFSSPVVLDFCEQVKVDGAYISGEELASCVEEVERHWDKMAGEGDAPSGFESMVAVAMEHYRRQRCDIVVLEVGMGGAGDATNVIPTPLCSVITSIGIDHTQFLGDTVEQIAREKCGIIKKGGTTVCYPEQDADALAVIMERCAQMDNRLLMANVASLELTGQDISGSRFLWNGQELAVSMAGRHQVCNALSALTVCDVLREAGYNLPDSAVKEGLASALLPSRLEILSREPLVLLDGAHNDSGAKALAQALKLLEGKKIHAVAGMLRDKEVEQSLSRVLPLCASVVAVSPPNPRAMPAEELAGLARKFLHTVSARDNYREAVGEALGRCGEGEAVLLLGSLYQAAALREAVAAVLAENRENAVE